jgi:hypothetical protein
VTGSVSQAEWLRVAAVAVVVVGLSSLPYAAGYLAQSPDLRFVDAVYDWEDYYSHLAKMQQGRQGAWRYHILFTAEDHPGVFINTFYIALGHLAALLGLSPVLVFHLARPVCALVLLLAVYAFIAMFIREREVRWTAYVLACLSSGLGWLVLLLTRSYTLGGITPVDFWLIEMYTFFTVLTFPHTCLAQAAQLLAFAWMVRLLAGAGGWRVWLGAAGAAAVLAVIHPYSLLPLDASLCLYGLYRWIRHRAAAVRTLLWLAGFAALPLPLVLYSYRAISSNPVLSAWQAQSYTLSPPPFHYLLGYGLLLPLAIWGGVRLWREGEQGREAPLVLWLLCIAPLLYLPLIFYLQRRMIEGAHVPLCILAAVGLHRGLLRALRRSRPARWLARRGYSPRRLQRVTQWLLVALTTLSTWYLLASLSLTALSGYDPLYRTRAEVEAVQWLGRHTAPEDTVLSSYEMGGTIPAWIGHRVFWGHWAETIHLPQKRAAVRAFYSASTDLDRLAFLARYDIAYVFHGPRERALGGFDPAAASWLELVFQSGEVAVYHVALEE